MFSIIIRSEQNSEKLRDCIRSCSNQSLKNASEILLQIEHPSTWDPLTESQFPCDVRLMISEDGKAYSWVDCVSLSRFDYIITVNESIKLPEDYLMVMRETIRGQVNQKIGCFYSKSPFSETSNHLTMNFEQHRFDSIVNFERDIFNGAVLKKSVIKKIGFLDNLQESKEDELFSSLARHDFYALSINSELSSQ